MPPSRFLEKGYKARKYKENEELKGMIKILFVCHGNICRSPIAEFVFRDMVKKQGIEERFQIASAATSSEEIGSKAHRGTRQVLKEHGIEVTDRCAVKMKKEDYLTYDYLIGMDQRNIHNMIRIIGGDPEEKIWRLLDFTDEPGDIADPWYTGDFNLTYQDVVRGCESFLTFLNSKRGNR